ncbi:peroxidase 27-like protein [Tanacetum coccineum]
MNLLLGKILLALTVSDAEGKNKHFGHLTTSDLGLNLGFYKKTCPRAEAIVKRTTANFISRAPSLAAPLLTNAIFQDCFMLGCASGCDGSVLLNSTKNNQAEKSGIPNLSLRGFQVIELLIKTCCRRDVLGCCSCADYPSALVVEIQFSR